MKAAFIVNSFPAISETFILNQVTGLLDLGVDVDIYCHREPAGSKMHQDYHTYRLDGRSFFRPVPKNRLVRLGRAAACMGRCLVTDMTTASKLPTLPRYKDVAPPLHLLFFLAAFRNRKYDIIHCHYGPNGRLGELVKACGLGKKLVVMFHGYDIRRAIASQGRQYRSLFNACDCLLAISRFTAQNLQEFGADPSKIIMHPVGVDTRRFSVRRGLERYDSKDPLRILSVGRLVPEKGHEYGLRALKHFLGHNGAPAVSYTIVGSGELNAHLRGLCSDLDMEAMVSFKGEMTQEELVKEMQQQHLFVLPSIAEVLPVSVMEAQAAGLPVIATDVGGVRELVRDGISGLIVPPGDVEALSGALGAMAAMPQRWQEMGRAGRKHTAEHYDIRGLTGTLYRIYESLLA